MNAIMERWVRTRPGRTPLRTLVRNQAHLLHALREHEQFHNQHRPHRTLEGAAPLRPRPNRSPNPGQLTHLNIHRNDRLRGIPHEYQHMA
jgi:putative transposase